MTATVEIRNVVKRYGKVEAVRDVSFDLPEGETVALVGHNGAGKTTLMKLMLGPASGRRAAPSRCSGDDPGRGRVRRPAQARLPARERLVQRRPDGTRDPGVLRPPEAASRHRPSRRCSSGSASTHARRPPRRHLFQGHAPAARARPGAARASRGFCCWTSRPPASTRRCASSFYEIVEELRGRGATVLLSSHALTELEERAGRVIIMNRGVKVADGTLDELRRIARLPTRIRLKVTDAGLDERAELARAGRRLAPGQRPNRSRSTPRRSARSRCCGARPTRARRSRMSTWSRRRWTSSMLISCVAGGARR